jgi:integrase/recombinase XerD
MSYHEELSIKILGKVSLLCPEIDQLKLREELLILLYNYEIGPAERALVASDIDEKVDLYLAVKKLEGLSSKTLKNYELILRKFSNRLIKPVSTITTNDLRLYMAVTTKNLKQTTIGTIISTFKSFFGWMANEEMIPKDPTRSLKTPKIPIRLRNSLTIEEVERLRDACNTVRQRALLEFIFSTGARVSEVVNAKRDDINWQTLSLRVIGKGDKERVVYISEKSKMYVMRYLESRTDNTPALFISQKYPYHGIGARAIQDEINNIASYAGFEKSIYPHLLRHTMATLALKAGASLTTIQTILGHTDPATTEVYAEISNDTVAAEYKKYISI